MGKQFTVAADYSAVRYSLSNPINYNAGDVVVLTDADYATLPASLTRTVASSPAVATVAEPTYPSYPFESGTVSLTQSNVSASSGVVANASAVATLPAVSGKTTFITGFTVNALGATAASNVTVTVTGITNTLTYDFSFPAGATTQATPLNVTLPSAIPASSSDTAIVVTVPAGGAGNTNTIVNAYAYQQ